jgi:hypothetical protein
MTAELFFYLMLVGWCNAPGPELGELRGEEFTVPNVLRGLYRSYFGGLLDAERHGKYWANLDEREFWRQRDLRYVRNEVIHLEVLISQNEKFAAEANEFNEPDLAAKFRREAEEWRGKIRELRAEERRLLEKQPGGYTAPAPPREKQ